MSNRSLPVFDHDVQGRQGVNRHPQKLQVSRWEKKEEADKMLSKLAARKPSGLTFFPPDGKLSASAERRQPEHNSLDAAWKEACCVYRTGPAYAAA